jgi:thiamine transport system permease protein
MAAATIVVVAVLASLVPMVQFAVAQGGRFTLDGYVWSVVRFTLLQAGLSTLISVVVALPAAWALAARPFYGGDALLALFAVPQMLPSIVVVLAFTGVFGHSGWLPNVIELYGLGGILLAHAFFNVPLCIRLFVEALQRVQPENQRLGSQLGLSEWQQWRHIAWPALRLILPRAAALVFLYCAASFVVVLTFGGPSATTLEVAIYQSLRLDFDVARAITLSVLQIVLCLVLVLMAGSLAQSGGITPRLRQNSFTNSTQAFNAKHGLALLVPVALVVPPLLYLIWRGIPEIELRPILLQAAFTSMMIALVSAVLTVVLAWPLASIAARQIKGSAVFQAIALLGMIVPPAVLATGWFILFRESNGGLLQSAVLVCLLNSLMALPLVFAILTTAMVQNTVSYDQLCAQLNISNAQRFLTIEVPLLRSAIVQSLLMAGLLSLGDLTAVMLLGTQGLVTLPSLIASEMGNYRSTTAQGTALILAAACFVITLLATRFSVPKEQSQ